MNAVIIGNGAFPKKEYPRELLRRADLIVCCDRGLEAFLRNRDSIFKDYPAAPAPPVSAEAPAVSGAALPTEAPAAPAPPVSAEAPAVSGTALSTEAPAAPAPPLREPDVVIGDMDSLRPALQKAYSKILVHIGEQDDNDQTKAFRYILEHFPAVDAIHILAATGKREDHTVGNLSLLMEYAREYGACGVPAASSAPSTPSDLSTPSAPSGPSTLSGPSVPPGSSAPSVPPGPSGPSTLSGPSGPSGSSGPSVPPGPSDPSGLSTLSGNTGSPARTGRLPDTGLPARAGKPSREVYVDMVSDYSTAFAITGSCELHIGTGRAISLFSPDNTLRITSRGLQWPTDGVVFDNWWKATLNRATTDTVSLTLSHPSIALIILD